MEKADPRFHNIDLGSLLEDLFRHANWLFGQKHCGADDSVMPGTGISSHDLVKAALTQFIVEKGEWRPTALPKAQAELFFFVRRMITNDFLDLLKKGRAFQRTLIIDDSNRGSGTIETRQLPNDDSKCTNPNQDLEDDEISKRAYKAVEGEPDLRDYLDAVLRDSHTKRSTVAKEIGISLDEATRRRDRLKTRLTPLKRALEARASKSHVA
jgi:hypothetical protein